MKKAFIIFLFYALVLPNTAHAKHACIIGAPLENCSHEKAACTDIVSNLRLGSRGEQVTKLQTYMSTYGYLQTTPTGYFGNQTLASVKTFQKAYGIDQTGFVGPLTRTKIKNISCTNASTNMCTQEARICSDGSAMPRDASSCEWQPGKCSTSITNTQTSGAWSTWTGSLGTLNSNSMLDNLKKVLESIGIHTTNFATTTMSETEILQMTRNFELQYIGK